MSDNLVRFAKDLFIEWVRERVPREEWRKIRSFYDIQDRLEFDAEEDMRLLMWEEIKRSICWDNLIWDIEQMAQIEGVAESDEETEEESESEDEDERRQRGDASSEDE